MEAPVRGGGKVYALKLKKDFNAQKAVDFPWTYEVTKYASQQPFLHLQAAFRRFFDKKSRYSRFKRKEANDRFYIGGDHIQVSGKRIRIPRLSWVRSAYAQGASAGPRRSPKGEGGMREEQRFSGRVVSATVCRIADSRVQSPTWAFTSFDASSTTKPGCAAIISKWRTDGLRLPRPARNVGASSPSSL